MNEQRRENNNAIDLQNRSIERKKSWQAKTDKRAKRSQIAMIKNKALTTNLADRQEQPAEKRADNRESVDAGHIPLRMCIACRKRRPKSELLRMVSIKGEIFFDERQKLPGRGAYICPSLACLHRCRRSSGLPHALRFTAQDGTVSVNWQELTKWLENHLAGCQDADKR